jgi:hypothetical protein
VGKGRIQAAVVDAGRAAGAAAAVATHTASAPTATARGNPPMGIVRTTAPSTRARVPRSGLTAHSAPAPKAMSVVPVATRMVLITSRSLRPGTTRQSVPSAGAETHAPPRPAAIDATELASTLPLPTTALDRASMRVTRPSAASAQTLPAPAAMARARTPGIADATRLARGSILSTRSSGPMIQTPPPSTARWSETASETVSRARGSGIVARGARVSRSRRASVVATRLRACARGTRPPLPTHTAPDPTATSVGVAPMAKVSAACDRGSIRDSV